MKLTQLKKLIRKSIKEHLDNRNYHPKFLEPSQKVGGKEVKYSKNSKNLPDCCWDMAKKACCKSATGLCPCNIYTGSDGQTHGTFSADCCSFQIRPGGAGSYVPFMPEGRGEWGDLDACDCDELEVECGMVDLDADCEQCMCKDEAGEAYPRNFMNIREENSCKQDGFCCGKRYTNTRVNASLENGTCTCPDGSRRINC